MSYFFAVRGWLEVDPDKFNSIILEIERLILTATDEKHKLYLKGWVYKQVIVNWTGYVFYGADVDEVGLHLLTSVIGDLAKIDGEIEGYFQVRGEDNGERYDIIVEDGEVNIRNGIV